MYIVLWGLHILEERKRVEYHSSAVRHQMSNIFICVLECWTAFSAGKETFTFRPFSGLFTVIWTRKTCPSILSILFFSCLVISFVLLECCAESGCWSRQLLLRLLFVLFSYAPKDLFSSSAVRFVNSSVWYPLPLFRHYGHGEFSRSKKSFVANNRNDLTFTNPVCCSWLSCFCIKKKERNWNIFSLFFFF